MQVNIQPFSIKYNDNNGSQYVARTIQERYVPNGGGAWVPVACDDVNVAQIDNSGKVLNSVDMTHEQFISYLLQQGISVPFNQYEMPKNN